MFKLTCLFSVLALAACEYDENERLDRLEAVVPTLTTPHNLATQIAAEAAARMQADVSLLAEAKAYTDTALLAEADMRAKGDEETLAAAKAYTDTAAMKPGATVKLPHLIADQTGEDLGVLLGGNVVYNEKLKAEIDVALKCTELFEQPDCKGNSVIRDDNYRVGKHYNGHDGTVLRSTGTIMFSYESARSINGQCLSAQPNTVLGVTFLDTKMPAKLFQSAQLRVELR